MEEAKLAVSVAAVLLSLASFGIAQRSAAKARKKETLTHLLGDKETVSYAALKLLRDGLPNGKKDRALVVSALFQACLLESSDRARALLYSVIEKNRAEYGGEMLKALAEIASTYDSMENYKFSKEELDLKNGRLRLAAVTKVLKGHKSDG
jgi:hypothetical protein